LWAKFHQYVVDNGVEERHTIFQDFFMILTIKPRMFDFCWPVVTEIILGSSSICCVVGEHELIWLGPESRKGGSGSLPRGSSWGV
jgi:hypothetical protein